MDCLFQCKSDTNCIFECDYKASACRNSCPCYENCPNGCYNCDTIFCNCMTGILPPSYDICEEFYSEVYTKCLTSCQPSDLFCLATCGREYETNLETCPCQIKCPNGCPCPEYNCPNINGTTTPITTTAQTTLVDVKTSVLVLSTSDRTNPPVITDANGRFDTNNFLFMYGENTWAHYSCSLTFRNQFYLFGGDQGYTRQISRLNGCSIERIGSLDFESSWGGCANVNDDRIYLCFSRDKDDYRTCRYAVDPVGEFTIAEQSLHPHQGIRIAASESESRFQIYGSLPSDLTQNLTDPCHMFDRSFIADILAVGSDNPPNVSSELLLTNRNTWIAVGDYPYEMGLPCNNLL